ncbi:MAG: hypothetical protein WA160_02150 [Pseudobdellovibrio sp.]
MKAILSVMLLVSSSAFAAVDVACTVRTIDEYGGNTVTIEKSLAEQQVTGSVDIGLYYGNNVSAMIYANSSGKSILGAVCVAQEHSVVCSEKDGLVLYPDLAMGSIGDSISIKCQIK